jgi:hypothetical protein
MAEVDKNIDHNLDTRWIGGEFISAERVCVWSDSGRAYLYKLPTNCIVESKDFHNKSKVTADTGKSLMFCQFDLGDVAGQKNLECPPVFKYLIFSKDGKWMKFLLRGDAEGRLAVWKVPGTIPLIYLILNFCFLTRNRQIFGKIFFKSYRPLEPIQQSRVTTPALLQFTAGPITLRVFRK